MVNASSFDGMPIRVQLSMLSDLTLKCAVAFTKAINEGGGDRPDSPVGTQEPRVDRVELANFVQEVVTFVLEEKPDGTRPSITDVFAEFGDKFDTLNWAEWTAACMLGLSGNLSAIDAHFGDELSAALGEEHAHQLSDMKQVTVIPITALRDTMKRFVPDEDWDNIPDEQLKEFLPTLDDDLQQLIVAAAMEEAKDRNLTIRPRDLKNEKVEALMEALSMLDDAMDGGLKGQIEALSARGMIDKVEECTDGGVLRDAAATGALDDLNDVERMLSDTLGEEKNEEHLAKLKEIMDRQNKKDAEEDENGTS